MSEAYFPLFRAERWREDTVNNNKLAALSALITSNAVRTSVCEVGACIRGVGGGEPLADPAKGLSSRLTVCWRLLLWDHGLSYPKFSQALKIKSPWDSFWWAGEPCTVSASRAPRWRFHGRFFLLFVKKKYSHAFAQVFWPLQKFHNCFLPPSLFSSTFLPIKDFFLLLLLPPCLLCCFSVFRSWSLWWQCTSQE